MYVMYIIEPSCLLKLDRSLAYVSYDSSLDFCTISVTPCVNIEGALVSHAMSHAFNNLHTRSAHGSTASRLHCLIELVHDLLQFAILH